MTKTIIAVLIIAGLGVGAYVAFKPQETIAPQVSGQNETVQTENVPEGKKMAFSEFMKQGGSYSCTVSQEVQNTTAQGTVYISEGNLRGDFTTSFNGTKMNLSTIVRDGYSYTWSSLMPNSGFKVKVATPNEVDSKAPSEATYSFNADTIGEYDCDPWTPDASKFAIPTSVTFKTL
jgi:hypothetical protein